MELNSKEMIVREALCQFLLKGYDNVSFNDIVHSLGFSKGRLTHYFKSKEDLFADVIAYFFDQLENNPSSVDKSPENLAELMIYLFSSVESINNHLSSITGVTDGGMNYHQLFLDSIRVLPDNPLMNNHFKVPLIGLTQFLNNEKDVGRIKNEVVIDHLAFQILATVEGCYMLNFYQPINDLHALSQSMVRHLLEGVKND